MWPFLYYSTFLKNQLHLVSFQYTEFHLLAARTFANGWRNGQWIITTPWLGETNGGLKQRNTIRKKLFLMFDIITKLNMNSITKIESGWYTNFAKINAQSSAFFFTSKNENTLFSFSWFLQNHYFWLHVKCDYFYTVFLWSAPATVFSLSCREYSDLLSNL